LPSGFIFEKNGFYIMQSTLKKYLQAKRNCDLSVLIWLNLFLLKKIVTKTFTQISNSLSLSHTENHSLLCDLQKSLDTGGLFLGF
jgi:hypothetical protein